VTTDFAQRMDGYQESYDCNTKAWQLEPMPIPYTCSATVTWMGFGFKDLTQPARRITLFGGPAILAPTHPDPFRCQYGDRSLSFYDAKGRLPAGLLDARKTEVVLRGDEKAHVGGEGPNAGRTDTEWKTTVYLVFKRAG
jgi:hypothetical protein